MFVKPFVSETEASQAFQKINKWHKQTPVKIELVYFPYYLFRISVVEDAKGKALFLALDGISGEFTFLDMKNLEFKDKSEGMPCFNFQIQMKEAKEKVVDEYRGVLIRYRQYKKGHTKIGDVEETKEFYYPYWVGYYKEEGKLGRQVSYTFKAIDGISGKFIGLKMHRAFLKGFSKGLSEK